ncbi:alkaline phosphatase family protein [Piscibacillus sp. B03]|uniref:alkaline phosphatase family protein n=1 Tax=Piscibacillus sp. B03 TaxID=3457430 RepID=UPI003FCCB114
MSKPIILLNIDSLMSEPLIQSIQSGKAPALKFLLEQGRFLPEVVSSFPTMSVTIDSTLLTGTYADEHQVPALNWFDVESQRLINYGTGLRETIAVGFSRSVLNMFNRLNNIDLNSNTATLFEEIQKVEKKSAAINSFVYRGPKRTILTVPKLLRLFTNIGDQLTTLAPDYLSIGAFKSLRKTTFAPFLIGGNRKFAGRELRFLIKNNLLPDFTFCIFQDMDARVHNLGPFDFNGIKNIDKEIQKTLNLYGSWQEAIEKCIWLIMGDNGQSTTSWNFKDVEINLNHLLSKYRIHQINKPVQDKDQLVLAVNQRMAYIYLLDENLDYNQVADTLKDDSRIDIIAWKEDEGIKVISGQHHGEMSFKPGEMFKDEYNAKWDIKGNYNILNINVEENYIYYNDYPDALARLYGALNSHKGRFIVINAKPGCEFLAKKTPIHIGGACHGSLHKQDSSIPLVITGTREVPTYARLVDMKEFILTLINNKI